MKYILTSFIVLILLFINCEKKLNMPSTPSGPSAGIINYNYYFSSSATSINDDSVAIRFDWGDGDTSYWSEYAASGDSITVSHKWTTAGTFSIRAQARTKKMQISDWSFNKDFIASSNRPPDAPQNPSGLFSGSVNNIYSFSTSAFDADADSLAYQFDWGDGEISEWTAYLASGQTVFMSHAWADTGSYQIRARAKDNQALMSSWSYAHNLEINLTGSLFPNVVIDNIMVGDEPAGITILPNGNYIYVANQTSADISVIRASNHSVIATIPVGNAPIAICASVNSNYVFIANSGSNNIMTIRTSDNTVINTIPVGNLPSGLSVSPNGEYLYVTNQASDNVSVIRLADFMVIATIANINQPSGIVSLPNSQYLYVTCPYQNIVAVIRASDNTVIANIVVDNHPLHLTSCLSGDFVYVTNYSGNSISIIRTSDNQVIDTIAVAGNPFAIAAYPDANFFYVTNYFDQNVFVINGSNNRVIGSIPVQTNPGSIAMHPDGGFVYIANSGADNVSVIKKF